MSTGGVRVIRAYLLIADSAHGEPPLCILVVNNQIFAYLHCF